MELAARSRPAPVVGPLIVPGIMSSWFPAVEWLPNYRRSWFGNDLRALVTALMVPQSLGYAAIDG